MAGAKAQKTAGGAGKKGVWHKYFIPHEGNNYHPHMLHTKRAVFYGGLFVALKALVIAFAVLIPAEAFLSPDVLAEQSRKIFSLVNELRQENNLPPLATAAKLGVSAQNRADDLLALQYFSHSGPQGHNLTYFLNQAGYKYYVAGENLAMGFSDAQDVVAAWIKSPTHYANLISNNFSQTGLGLVSGDYQGVPTVFVAEHFGLPAEGATPAPAAPVAVKSGTTTSPQPSPKLGEGVEGETKPREGGQVAVLLPPAAPVKTEPVSQPSEVAGETVKEIPIATTGYTSPQPSPKLGEGAEGVTPKLEEGEEKEPTLAVLAQGSSLNWSPEGSRTKVEARVAVTGLVASAAVNVDGFPLNLKETEPGIFTGSVVLPEKANDLFRVVTAPSVHLVGLNNTTADGVVEWTSPKIVSQTPWERYVMASSWLGKSIPLFVIVRALSLLALIFFSLVLVINISVEFKKQHPHVVAQTLGLLVVLAIMVKI